MNWYYRARYYDSAIGRFTSEDPITFAGGENFYLYVANNPADLIDPNGLRFTVHGDRDCFNKAKQYLMTLAPSTRAFFQFAENSPEEFVVDVYSDFFTGHNNSKGNHILWYCHRGLRCPNGTTQTPALGLFHELVHAVGPHVNYSFWNPKFGLDEELQDILGPETNAAQELGEGTRTEHHGSYFPVLFPFDRRIPKGY